MINLNEYRHRFPRAEDEPFNVYHRRLKVEAALFALKEAAELLRMGDTESGVLHVIDILESLISDKWIE